MFRITLRKGQYNTDAEFATSSKQLLMGNINGNAARWHWRTAVNGAHVTLVRAIGADIQRFKPHLLHGAIAAVMETLMAHLHRSNAKANIISSAELHCSPNGFILANWLCRRRKNIQLM